MNSDDIRCLAKITWADVVFCEACAAKSTAFSGSCGFPVRSLELVGIPIQNRESSVAASFRKGTRVPFDGTRGFFERRG